jgi:hypothetical protein
VNTEPTEPGYLDAIFASIRASAAEITAMKGWLKNAESSRESSWSLHFLAAARTSHERARAGLENVEARVRALGPPDDIPAPLDRLPLNVAAMRADLRNQRSHMLRLESELASRPLGTS